MDGCKPVFLLLKDVFPQVDARLLKAVAIEHSEDTGAAIDFIISEVLSSLEGSTKTSVLVHSQEPTDSPTECGTPNKDVFLPHQQDSIKGSMFSGPLVASEGAVCDDYVKNSHSRTSCIEVALGKKSHAELSELKVGSLLLDHDDAVQEVNLPSLRVSVPSDADYTHDVSPESHLLKEVVTDTPLPSIHYHRVPTEEPEEETLVEQTNAEELCKSGAKCVEATLCESRQEFSLSFVEKNPGCASTVDKDVQSSSDLDADHHFSANSTSAQDVMLGTLANSSDFMECRSLVTKDSNILASEQEIQETWYLAESGSQLMSFETEMVSVVENAELAMTASQSSQIVGIDFLEELINDSKTKKKSLVSALKSLNCMVKEVEYQEERAKQFKEAASKAGEDILSKTEDLKQKAKQAKEANDMHAGEVYGEKSVLATEARELQSRLVRLSDKRDESLSVIEQICEVLETRVATAREEQAAAERLKLEKEESARKLLNEQELIMNKIVQDSEQLQHAAEENSKLREFLVDRGRIVDVLQGEIAVICEDVLLLKKQIDGLIPLTRSFCTPALGFSSSYQRNIYSGEVARPLCFVNTPKTTDKEPPGSLLPGNIANTGKEHPSDQRKESLGDDWELCDDRMAVNG